MVASRLLGGEMTVNLWRQGGGGGGGERGRTHAGCKENHFYSLPVGQVKNRIH